MLSTKYYLRGTPPPSFEGGQVDSWRDRAACHNHARLLPSTWDDSVMTDDDARRDAPAARAKRIAAAKAVCRTECPVREACMEDVDLDYDEGVRGGEDLRDVRAGRRRQVTA